MPKKSALPTAPPHRKAHPLTELVHDQIRSFEVLANHADDVASQREYRALGRVLAMGLPLSLAKGLEV